MCKNVNFWANMNSIIRKHACFTLMLFYFLTSTKNSTKKDLKWMHRVFLSIQDNMIYGSN